jgi:hypothetical protein
VGATRTSSIHIHSQYTRIGILRAHSWLHDCTNCGDHDNIRGNVKQRCSGIPDNHHCSRTCATPAHEQSPEKGSVAISEHVGIQGRHTRGRRSRERAAVLRDNQDDLDLSFGARQECQWKVQEGRKTVRLYENRAHEMLYNSASWSI